MTSIIDEIKAELYKNMSAEEIGHLETHSDNFDGQTNVSLDENVVRLF
jgi:hypothetical protein